MRLKDSKSELLVLQGYLQDDRVHVICNFFRCLP